MKLAALCIIIHPLLILGFTALALSIPEGINGITNPSFHACLRFYMSLLHQQPITDQALKA